MSSDFVGSIVNSTLADNIFIVLICPWRGSASAGTIVHSVAQEQGPSCKLHSTSRSLQPANSLLQLMLHSLDSSYNYFSLGRNSTSTDNPTALILLLGRLAGDQRLHPVAAK